MLPPGTSLAKSLPLHLPLLIFVLLAVLVLTGCVQYRLDVRFDNASQGQVIQHLRLPEQLTERVEVDRWLAAQVRQARALGGNGQRVADQEWLLEIPFTTADLEQRLQQVLGSLAGDDLFPPVLSQFHLSEQNFLLLVRHRLVWDLDLRSWGISTPEGQLLASPAAFTQLEFHLHTSWGAQAATALAQGSDRVWQLKPGEVNHLEAAFWSPSPFGLGTLGILLLVGGGTYLKGRHQPVTPPT